MNCKIIVIQKKLYGENIVYSNSCVFQWHALDRSEQAKYYEMARKEKELHLQLYPGWSARDNYAVHAKKKKRKKDVLPGDKVGTRPDDRFMDNPAFGKYQGREPCMQG